MLKRKIYQDLIKWKNTPNRLSLLIKGARQVGKTYIIRHFGTQNYKRFIEINFEKHPSYKQAFAGDLDARTILIKLSSMGIGPLIEGETLFFFDEIQSCPEARTAIKFLVEDGKYDYITSGSLLGINYKDVSSYPVGYEQQLSMFPLDFEEFLWAKGVSDDVIAYLLNQYKKLESVDAFIHEQILNHYRHYLIVGGMPAVVQTFLTNDDFSLTLSMQKSLLDSYRDDISKYALSQKEIVKSMYDAIPEQISKKNKRFILSSINQISVPLAKYHNASTWLVDAGIAHHCFNITALEAPLIFSEKRNLYKLYMHDTGLLCALASKGTSTSILNNDFSVNEGAMTENAIAISLVMQGYPLYYYDKNSRTELDFVITEPKGLCLIEVKSGNSYKKHASLSKSIDLAQTNISRRIVLSKFNIEQNEEGIIYLPLYMSMFIRF